MYTSSRDDVYEDHWSIFDPCGDWLCTVTSKEQADALLSHLNLG